MSTASRVIKNTGFLYARMGITVFISLYTTRLVLDALGASDFGIFNIVGGAIAMLGFLNASMAAATQRFMSHAEGAGDKERQKKIFNVSFVLHIVIAIVLGLILLGVGYFFFDGVLNIDSDRIDAAKVVYASLIISTMFTVMTVPYDAVLNAHENMLYYTIVGVVESLLKLFAAFFVIHYSGDQLIMYGILMACIPLFILTIMRVYCHRKYEECKIAPKQYMDRPLMREMAGFAGWRFLGSSSSMISQYGLGIVLNIFFGAALNAAQGIANQISGQLMVFSNNMMKAVNPVITKSEGMGQREKMVRISVLTTKTSVSMLALLAIPFILESEFLMSVWLKEVPNWAVLFVQLQLVRVLLEQFTMPFNTSIAAQGNVKHYEIAKSIVNILPIIVTYVLFSYDFPAYYMYLSWIFFWGLLKGCVIVYYTQKNCGLTYKRYLKDLAYPLFSTCVLMFLGGCLASTLLPSSIFRVCIVGVVSTCIFLVLQFFVFMNKQQRSQILEFVNNKIVRFASAR